MKPRLFLIDSACSSAKEGDFGAIAGAEQLTCDFQKDRFSFTFALLQLQAAFHRGIFCEAGLCPEWNFPHRTGGLHWLKVRQEETNAERY
jgi:hypothetical protein